MELDETDPAVWLKLEAATNEYIQNNSQAFKNACERLIMPFQLDEKWSDNLKPQHISKTKASDSGKFLLQIFIYCHYLSSYSSFLICIVYTATEVHGPSLGWRRNVLLVEALHSPDSGRTVHHVHALESFCARSSIRLSFFDNLLGSSRAVPSTALPTPFTSPLFTGSFPSSPLLYSPDIGHQRIGRIDLVPPLSLDGSHLGKITASPPKSPSRPRELSLLARSLHGKLQNSPQVGIIHLALQSDSNGLILRSTLCPALLHSCFS